MVTLALRSCVARQEPYIPGALSILQGTVPGRVRGSGHMVPTYFRRELRDRALQRPSRLRTFVSLFLSSLFPQLPLAHPVFPRESGGSSTPRLHGSITAVSGMLDRPFSRAMTVRRAGTARSALTPHK